MPLACRFVDKIDWDKERPKPGDLFWISFASGHCSNHEPPCERHLNAVLPNGHWWDIDGRASNCTMPEDKVHHCWVRHGEPPTITVDKNGVTCQAGAGSIQSDDYHGFLQNGHFT